MNKYVGIDQNIINYNEKIPLKNSTLIRAFGLNKYVGILEEGLKVSNEANSSKKGLKFEGLRTSMVSNKAHMAGLKTAGFEGTVVCVVSNEEEQEDSNKIVAATAESS